MLIWNKEKAKTKWNKNLTASYIYAQLKMFIFNSTKNEFRTSKAFQKNGIIIININCCHNITIYYHYIIIIINIIIVIIILLIYISLLNYACAI